jgi:glutathione synthase/RimK-type ligase-like ATP-grasp enzyme
MHRLGLDFGAIDLAYSKDTKEYYFLEVNPAGQWLWLEEELGLPITKALVDYLISPIIN